MQNNKYEQKKNKYKCLKEKQSKKEERKKIKIKKKRELKCDLQREKARFCNNLNSDNNHIGIGAYLSYSVVR